DDPDTGPAPGQVTLPAGAAAHRRQSARHEEDTHPDDEQRRAPDRTTSDEHFQQGLPRERQPTGELRLRSGPATTTARWVAAVLTYRGL
ncbi:MAG: hypothetical protein ACRYF3_04060, partial [Janthinobacterium lividum]